MEQQNLLGNLRLNRHSHRRFHQPKKPRGEGVGEKSDTKISAINDPENREGKHPFQFWIAYIYLSVPVYTRGAVSE